ncbi:MAG: hypothetical protein WA190_11200 [Usitatibacter sp.]
MADPKNIPPEVAELLRKGDKMGAMKLMLQLNSPASHNTPDHMARPQVPVPRATPPGYVKRTGLSPGEVARADGSIQAIIVIAAIAAAIGLYFAFG